MEREVNSTQNPYNIAHHTQSVLPHYLLKIKFQIFDKLRIRSTFSRPAKVSIGISKLSLTDLIFVDPRVKINGGYYRQVFLLQQLLCCP